MTDATLIEHLDDALNAVLTARIIAGQVEAPSVPDEALRIALGADDNYRRGRGRVREALDGLRETVDGETWAKVLILEAAMNAAGAEALEVSWRLGWTAGS